MIEERYSIEVSDDFVEIHGDLTIEETFDYLNFFEKKGFKSITGGWENSTLVMSRKGVDEKWEETRQKQHEESEAFYENLYNQSEEKIKVKNRRVEELESTIRIMFHDESERVKTLKAQNEVLWKAAKQSKLSESEEFQKILNSFTFQHMGSTPPEEEIKVKMSPIDLSRIHADPMSIPSVEEL